MEETRTLRLSRERIAFAGRFRGGASVDDLIARTERRGGHATRDLTPETTVLVCGAGADAKARIAGYLGIISITQEELDALLLARQLDVQVSPPERVEEPALFGEVRSLLNEAPHVEGWAKLTRLLDRCTPEVEERIVPYAAGTLARWTARLGDAAHHHRPPNDRATIDEATRLHETDAWALHMPAEHPWRLMPERWVALLSRGERGARFGLATAMTLGGARLDAARAEAVITSPDLTRLHTLYLGYGASHARTFFRALREGPLFDQLCALHMDLRYIPPTHFAQLGRAEQASGLTTLALSRRAKWSASTVQRYVSDVVFAQVHTLSLDHTLFAQGLAEALLDRCPSLRCLDVRAHTHLPYTTGELEGWAIVAGEAETLRFAEGRDLMSADDRLRGAGLHDLLRNTRALELERWSIWPDPDALAHTALVQQIGAVWLGPEARAHPRLADALDAAGVEVLTTRPAPRHVQHVQDDREGGV